ncbi:MAG: c-type cytochrome [Acidocella sp.]|nr:c-type cytochrome [Acidocella sp.]
MSSKKFRFADAACLLLCLTFVGVWFVTFASAQATAPSSPAPGTVLDTPPSGMSGDMVAQPVTQPATPALAAQIARGKYLAVAGDCQYCHTTPGGAPYAGGVPLQTPFGDLFSPNITPDKADGIGTYTDAQFWNVMHNGISPGNSLLVFPRYLYPVMPWQDYNKLSYNDVMALKAYLDSITPVAQKNRETEMSFPFTMRAGLLAWRLLYFNRTPIQYNPSWTQQQRNGAYLVQALEHCAECHSQRNLLMAVEPSTTLAGGKILSQSWYAPNISSSKTDGVGGWSPNALYQYLAQGGAVGNGAPYGPMKAVVEDSLSRLPASDVQDIVAYLQTASHARDNPPAPPAMADATAGGAQVYADNCARCHGANGQGVTNNFPNLAQNPSISNGPADNLISMVLGGFTPWHQAQSGMPEFNQSLSDQQIAALSNFIRTSWGNQGQPNVTPADVAADRALASDWVNLSTGNTRARVAGQMVKDISGTLELYGDRANCTLDEHLTTSSGMDVHIVGACAQNGASLRGTLTLNGQASTETFRLGQQRSGNAVTGLVLYGALGSAGPKFDTKIALIPPTA